MLLVLTSEGELENEAHQINKLFENDLEVLHFRKPTLDLEGYKALIQKINPVYHDRIVLHQYHELGNSFKCRGIHIQERLREGLEKALKIYVNDYKEKGLTVSSSFHSIEDIKNCSVDFDYVLLSPVFESISKAGYLGKSFDVNGLNQFVIGMGGINENTLQATFDLGFKGVGVLGGIWNTKDSLKSFKTIYEKLKTIKK